MLASMRNFERGARMLQEVAATAVIVLVFVQLYLIAEYIFGDTGALSTHKTVGGIVPAVEVVVLIATLIGWRKDRVQVILSVLLLVVGVLQVQFAENIGSSPSVHALHGLLAVAVVLLAAASAHRCRTAFRPDA